MKIKQFILSFLFIVVTFQIGYAFELKDSVYKYTIEFPEKYEIKYQVSKLDKKDILRAILYDEETQTNINIYYFMLVTSANKQLNHKKALETPDSTFFKGLEHAIIIDQKMKGKTYDAATIYEIKQENSRSHYEKYYRYVDDGGICFIKVSTKTRDFNEADQIAESYSRSSIWWTLLALIFLIFIPALVICIGLEYRKTNMPKLIVIVGIGILFSLLSLIWLSWWMPLFIIALGFIIYYSRNTFFVVSI
ncbi:MAG: hypothetical protein V8Q28_03010 [Alistipes sp.]